jgi:hypothetical protein
VVDLLHAGRLKDGHNAGDIAAPGAAGIHQERLAGGGDIQRRVPALGVDEIDVQSLGRPALCAAHRRSQGEGQQERECSAHFASRQQRRFDSSAYWPVLPPP